MSGRDFTIAVAASFVLLQMAGAAAVAANVPEPDRPIAADDNSVNPAAGTAAFRPFNGSADGLKKIMWKRCMSKNYVTCVKLALVHLVDRLERANESYPLGPGVTLSGQKYGEKDDESYVTSAGRDSTEAFDRYFVDKLGRYFGSLTLNVKLLDDATARSVRMLGEAAAAGASVQTAAGRGKKQKYAQSILLAGWVTGAMLLALGMKAIAVLAGKALMTALMSLLLSALASFRGGHHHSEPKSTTYEIVTKPVYTHSHTTADDAHAAGTQNSAAYRRRSIAPGVQHVATAAAVPTSSDEEEPAEHIVYRIHASDKTPIYIPIERRRRRRR